MSELTANVDVNPDVFVETIKNAAQSLLYHPLFLCCLAVALCLVIVWTYDEHNQGNSAIEFTLSQHTIKNNKTM